MHHLGSAGRRATAAAVIVLVPLVALVATPAAAGTITVDCSKQSLQARIAAAAPGSTLLISGTCTGHFSLHKNLTLQGAPHATLDGSQTGRVLTITGKPTVHLIGLTITHGIAASGGGISDDGGKLTLSHVVVQDDEAVGADVTGGGIDFGTGSLVIAASSIVHDAAYASSNVGAAVAVGGGVFLQSGQLTITGSTISGNGLVATSTVSAGDAQGAGVEDQGGPVVSITSSHVDHNQGVARGPTEANLFGLGIVAPAVTLVHSTVVGNTGTSTTGGSGAMAFAGEGGIFAESFSLASSLTSSAVAGNRVTAVSTHGDADTTDAGVLVRGDSTIKASRITGNHGGATGAGTANSTVGGVFDSGHLTLVSSTVASNTASAHSGIGKATASAGGIEAGQGESITKSTVRGNRAVAVSDSSDAVATGGGVDEPVGSLVLRASTVSGNTSTATADGSHSASATGGGIELSGGSATNLIVNSTIANNAVSSHAGTASAGGAGIHSAAGTLHLVAATVAGSTSNVGAGGLLVDTGTTTLRATILASNTAPASPDCQGSIASAGHNLIGKTGGCLFGATSTDELNKPPKLGPLHGNGGPTTTMAVLVGSPALNAIPKTVCPVLRDQRGIKRPQGPGCDIGAYERSV
jgi:hypothetical protein